jgi:uncharacterized protein (TIGR03000 family)
MYSVVLATVLTVGGTSAPAWGHHGCRGGCYGGCTGPVVSSCYGCNGACCGGCYGAGYGYARYGSFYGSCYGSCSGVFGGCCGGSACFGGGHVSFFAPYNIGGARVITSETPSVPIPPPVTEKKEDKESHQRSTQATVVVTLPDDAKMIVDGVTANLTSETRTFVTPDLLPGRVYYYMITAEIQREGRTIAHREKVLVRPGEISRVDFRDMTTASSAQR